MGDRLSVLLRARVFLNLQAALPLSTAARIFIFSKTVSLIFGKVDGNVTINLNICFLRPSLFALL
jgi:hypothetical protein